MKPVYQEFEYDCLRACIASILEIDIDKLPVPIPEIFYKKDDEAAEKYLNLLNIILRETQDCELFVYPKMDKIFQGYTIKVIKNGAFYHAVVAKDEVTVFNPDKDASNLSEEISHFILLRKLYNEKLS